jgi:hypothetical protein
MSPHEIPHDDDLEYGCLSSILNDPDIGSFFCLKLSADDFFSPKCRVIFMAASSVQDSGGSTTDLTTIGSKLSQLNGVAKNIRVTELLRIQHEIPVCIDVAGAEARLKELSRQRKIQELGAEIQRRVISDPAGVAGFIQDRLSNIGTESDAFPPLTPLQTALSGRLKSRPDPADFIVSVFGRPFLRRGVVGSLVAAGGTGKSFFILRFGMMLAAGCRWGPFTSANKLNVLYISGEDDQLVVDQRSWEVGEGIFPEKFHAASVVGKVGPLMEIGQNGNPQKSKWYTWLKKTIQSHVGLDVLILDPMSRFYGLNENSNEHATAFISMLEGLSIEFGLNILFLHHVNKGSNNEAGLTKNMGRGASAFTDGLRFVIGMKPLEQFDANQLGIDEDMKLYFKLDLTKTNNSGELSSPIFFKKDPDTGVPDYVDLWFDRRQDMSEAFYDAFVEHGRPEKRRDLLKGIPKELFKKIKEKNSDFATKHDVADVLDYLLSEGALSEGLKWYRGQSSLVIFVAESRE